MPRRSTDHSFSPSQPAHPARRRAGRASAGPWPPRRRSGPGRHAAVAPPRPVRPVVRVSPGPLGLLLAVLVLLVGTGAAGGVQEAFTGASSTLRTAVAVGVPRAKVALPAGIEDLSPYVQQVSCNPVAMPGAITLGDLLRATYPGTSYGIARACGADGIASEHYEGRAIDWMIFGARPRRRPPGRSAVLSWLLSPRRRRATRTPTPAGSASCT